jgi:hypothetical protein
VSVSKSVGREREREREGKKKGWVESFFSDIQEKSKLKTQRSRQSDSNNITVSQSPQTKAFFLKEAEVKDTKSREKREREIER